MSAPDHDTLKVWEQAWFWIASGIGGLGLAVRKITKPDDGLREMARALTDKAQHDTDSREAITSAINRLCAVTHEEAEETRKEIRAANERLSSLIIQVLTNNK